MFTLPFVNQNVRSYGISRPGRNPVTVREGRRKHPTDLADRVVWLVWLAVDKPLLFG